MRQAPRGGAEVSAACDECEGERTQLRPVPSGDGAVRDINAHLTLVRSKDHEVNPALLRTLPEGIGNCRPVSSPSRIGSERTRLGL